jgi:hypothetical protein
MFVVDEKKIAGSGVDSENCLKAARISRSSGMFSVSLLFLRIYQSIELLFSFLGQYAAMAASAGELKLKSGNKKKNRKR